MKRPAVLALLALVLAAVFFSVAAGRWGQGGAAPGLPGPAVGHPAPPFSLPELGGGTVSLAGLLGRPVLLNFWATWCPDCRAEMPALARFRAQVGAQVEVVGVDVHESTSLVSLFAGQNGLGWPILLDGQGLVTADYGVYYLPTSFFLDARGVIRRVYTGPMTLGQMRTFLEAARAA